MNVRRRAGLILLASGAIALGAAASFGWFHAGGQAGGVESHAHVHGEIPPREARPPYPTLSVDRVREEHRRVLRLEVADFAFVAPGETPPADAPNAGHAHLKIEDESIAMFYTDRYVLPRFQPGTYTLTVTLNGTDHAPLAVNGTVVSDTVVLEVNRTLPRGASR